MNIPRPTMPPWKVAILWAIALGCAATLDRPIARALRSSTIPGDVRRSILPPILKEPGHYRFVAIVAVVTGLLHPLRIRATFMVMCAGVWGGVGLLLKWAVGRSRPLNPEFPFRFQPFQDGAIGIANHAQFSFPSAQTLLAFATAASLAILVPRWKWAFYAGATLVALERLAENVHWLGDCVGAAGLGVVGVRLLWNPAATLAERAFNPQNVNQ